MLSRTTLVVCAISAGILAGGLSAQNKGAQWPFSGHDLADTRSQPNESKISPANVAGLQPKWMFNTGGDVSATPTVSDGDVYFPDWAGNLYAVDANSGKLIWTRTIESYNGRANSMARVGVAVSGSALILGDNVIQALPHDGAHVMAVDRGTGALLWITQVDAHPAAIVTGSPVVYNGVVYVGVSSNEEALATDPAYPCCTFRGSMVALNASTGAILWKTYTVPDNGGMPGGYSGNAIWGEAAIDPGRGSLYTATGNNYTVPDNVTKCQSNDHKAGTCTAANDYFETVLALDLSDGEVKWARRLSGYDAWTVACTTGTGTCPSPAGPDYDFGSGPNLLGNLVGVGQKSGIYWALNPNNGSILWGTSVGPGSTLGGIEWGSATDGLRIYVAITNHDRVSYQLANGGPTIDWGSWAALNPATGRIIWQVADPTPGGFDMGSVSVANGVVYTETFGAPANAPSLHALNAATGAILWNYTTGSSVADGPSVVSGMLFWGTGYSHIAGGLGDHRVFAFHVTGN